MIGVFIKRRINTNMPLYDLYCDCGYISERLLKLNSKLPECPMCGKVLRKALSPISFILKGGCWSKDNYSKTAVSNKEV